MVPFSWNVLFEENDLSFLRQYTVILVSPLFVMKQSAVKFNMSFCKEIDNLYEWIISQMFKYFCKTKETRLYINS